MLLAELLKLLMLEGVVDEGGVTFDDDVTFDVGIGAEELVVGVTPDVVVAAELLEDGEVGDDVVDAGLLLLLLLSLILLILPDNADSGVVAPLGVCSVDSDIFNCFIY